MSNGWESGTEGFVASCKQVLTEPADFFRSIDTEAPLSRAIVFSLIGYGIAGVGQAIWTVVSGTLNLVPMLSGADETEAGIAVAATGIGLAVQVGILLLMPLWMLMASFIWGGVTHLFLLLFGAGDRGYLNTVRANLYGGATGVLYLIPCCGSFVASIWGLVILVVGLAELHRASTGKVLAAVFAPLVLCCVIALVIVGAAFAIGGAAAFANLPEMLQR